MPRLAVLLSVIALVAASAAVAMVACEGSRAAAPAPLNPTYVISGHGWGHGIGMSQYGAYGYAQHGWTYDQILAHYYTGTTLGPAPTSRVRVLLATGRPSLAVSSIAPFRVTDATGTIRRLAAGAYTVGPKLGLTGPDGTTIPLTGPLVFAPGSAPLALGGSSYRGSLTVSAVSGKLQAVNSVGVDAYVQGVVPREMPASWAPEALEAQAVAARSYALANLHTGGSFDLYADTRSQVYGGIAAEDPASNAAVAATAGQVVLYDGQVADALFSSTSGGRTAAVEDVWPDAQPEPYLVSVPDPYDTISPYHNWAAVLNAAAVTRSLRVPGRLVDLQVALNPSLRVAKLTAVGTVGKVTVSGADARALLGLRSSWFRVGVLGQLATTVKLATLEYGRKATLSGVARGLPAVVQTRAPGGGWKPLGPFQPGSGGAVSVTVQPLVTTDYRLASGTAGGLPTRLAVAPRVRFYAVTDPAHLRGFARPARPGATVQVQILSGTDWTTVGTAQLDASGVFDATITPLAGTYRARLAAGHGLAVGYSPPLEVSGR